MGAMLRLGTLGGTLVCLTALAPLRAADVALPPAATTKIDFARDIEPLLAKRCYVCHGPQQQMSGLRLDQKEAALKGGAAGMDIIAGKSADSRLIQLVAGAGNKFMPPVGARLTAAEIGLLRAWIDQGAEWTARAPALELPEDSAAHASRGASTRVAAQRDRQLHPRAAGEGRHRALARSGPSSL